MDNKYYFCVKCTMGNGVIDFGHLTLQEVLEKVWKMFRLDKKPIKYSVDKVDTDGTLTIDFGYDNFKLIGEIKREKENDK